MTAPEIPHWAEALLDEFPRRYADVHEIAQLLRDGAITLRPFFEELEALESDGRGRRLALLRALDPALAIGSEAKRRAEQQAEGQRLREQIATKAAELAAIVRQAEQLPPDVRIEVRLCTDVLQSWRMVGYDEILDDLASSNRRAPDLDEAEGAQRRVRSDLARFLERLPIAPALSKRALTALCQALFPQAGAEAIGKAIDRSR